MRQCYGPSAGNETPTAHAYTTALLPSPLINGESTCGQLGLQLVSLTTLPGEFQTYGRRYFCTGAGMARKTRFSLFICAMWRVRGNTFAKRSMITADRSRATASHLSPERFSRLYQAGPCTNS